MNKRDKFRGNAKEILKKDESIGITSFLDYKPGEKKVLEIEIDKISENPYQPRKYFEESSLRELSESIKNNGVIQPIIVRIEDDDKFVLVAGERRLRAAKMSGYAKIPAIITTGNPIEISLIENLQRENLKPIEEAEALNKMIEVYQYTQEKLSRVLGKSKSTISEILSLVKLPEAIKQDCEERDISKRILIEIAKQANEIKMKRLYDRVIKENLKSEDLREIKVKSSESKNEAVKALKKVLDTSNILNNLKMDNLNSQEKEDLRKALNILNNLIGEILMKRNKEE